MTTRPMRSFTAYCYKGCECEFTKDVSDLWRESDEQEEGNGHRPG